MHLHVQADIPESRAREWTVLPTQIQMNNSVEKSIPMETFQAVGKGDRK